MHYMKVDLGDRIAHVNHNDDWSGDVYVKVVLLEDLYDIKGNTAFDPPGTEYTIPGEVLLAVGKAANKHSILGQVIAAIEDIE